MKSYYWKRKIKTIGKHINNALKEELDNQVVVAKFATVQNEGTKPRIVKSHDINLDSDYINWIHDVKQRYISTQIKATVKVNTERLYFNWQLGRDLVEKKQKRSGEKEL